ncbi:MAG: ABC-2 transporter permease [Lachnospiraceae bacterium]
MKAMLIKDLKLMKNLKHFFLLILVIGVACSVVYNSPSFVIAYMTVIFSSMAVSTISYDNYENGAAFFFTLPVSRKGYVREKYVLSMILVVVSLIAASLLSVVTGIARKTPINMDFLVTVLVTFLFAVLAVSYMMPIHLKYRADKSKLVIMLGIGIFILIAFFVVRFLTLWVDIEEYSDYMIRNKLPMVIIGMFVLAAVFLTISYNISIRIMEKKEF